jgi:glycosyltransferase involved in cell wall biosynthesis
MKISFVTPAPSLNGGCRVIAIYADQLRRRGHDVDVIARLSPRPSVRNIISSLRRGYGWPRNNPNTTYFDELGITPQFVDPRRPVTNSDVPDGDIVIATWWETAEWVARLSRAKGTKVYLIQDHEVFPYLPIERVEATWHMPFHKIVVSQWLAGIARTKYGDPDVSVVCNGVDLEQFYSPQRRKNPTPTVGLVYTSAARKACNLALQAFAIASKRLPELRLVAFSAYAPASELSLPSRTEFHLRPPQARLRELYAQCDAWLFSSKTEGFGLPILEAMACRTPVIATPAGAAPELLADGGGILVAPDDPDDMARAIEQIATMNEYDWLRLSELAGTTAAKHRWDAAGDLFEAALYTAIAKERKSTASAVDGRKLRG